MSLQVGSLRHIAAWEEQCHLGHSEFDCFVLKLEGSRVDWGRICTRSVASGCIRGLGSGGGAVVN